MSGRPVNAIDAAHTVRATSFQVAACAGKKSAWGADSILSSPQAHNDRPAAGEENFEQPLDCSRFNEILIFWHDSKLSFGAAGAEKLDLSCRGMASG